MFYLCSARTSTRVQSYAVAWNRYAIAAIRADVIAIYGAHNIDRS